MSQFVSPPTVTLSAGGATTGIPGSALVPSVISSATVNTAAFRYRGGAVALMGSTFPTYNRVSGRQNNTPESGAVLVDFMHTGAAFEIVNSGQGGYFRLKVDGVYVNGGVAMALGAANGEIYRILVTFGGVVKTRSITYETNGPGFTGVNALPADTLTAAGGYVGPRAVFIGDSYTEPTILDGGNYAGWTGWASVVAGLKGWDGWPAGAGSTGFSTTGYDPTSFPVITAIVSGGQITGYTVVSGGSGNSATLTTALVWDTTGTGATCKLTISSGVVTAAATASGGAEGSGYSASPTVAVSGTNPTGGRYKFGDRLQHDVISYAPQFVVVAGGINDVPNFSSEQATVTSLVASFMSRLAAGLPHASVFVLGNWCPTGSPTAAQIGMRNLLQAQAAANGLMFIDNVVAQTTAQINQGWITGTGNLGAPAGNGNADYYIGTDGTHPTSLGHVFLGQKVAAAITALGF